MTNASPVVLHLEHELVEQVENDPEACVEYNESMPQPYAQPRVDEAFQAQHTKTRVTAVLLTCAMDVLWDLGTALFGLFNKKTIMSFPPAAWACTGCLTVALIISS